MPSRHRARPRTRAKRPERLLPPLPSLPLRPHSAAGGRVTGTRARAGPHHPQPGRLDRIPGVGCGPGRRYRTTSTGEGGGRRDEMEIPLAARRAARQPPNAPLTSTAPPPRTAPPPAAVNGFQTRLVRPNQPINARDTPLLRGDWAGRQRRQRTRMNKHAPAQCRAARKG